jgi:hypothetical protein
MPRSQRALFKLANRDYDIFKPPGNNFNPVPIPETTTEVFHDASFAESTRTTLSCQRVRSHRQQHEYSTTDGQRPVHVRTTFQQISASEAAAPRQEGCALPLKLCQQISLRQGM